MNVEIKNCPCCGGKPEIRYTDRPKEAGYMGYTSNTTRLYVPGFVTCSKCGLMTQHYSTVIYAINKWNKRVGEENNEKN